MNAAPPGLFTSAVRVVLVDQTRTLPLVIYFSRFASIFWRHLFEYNRDIELCLKQFGSGFKLFLSDRSPSTNKNNILPGNLLS